MSVQTFEIDAVLDELDAELVALRMAKILYRLGYVEKGHLVSVTREDLVGQYVGHTAPKTKDVLKRAYGGVLFIGRGLLPAPARERA